MINVAMTDFLVAIIAVLANIIHKIVVLDSGREYPALIGPNH
jgi:hypothetical protein